MTCFNLFLKSIRRQAKKIGRRTKCPQAKTREFSSALAKAILLEKVWTDIYSDKLSDSYKGLTTISTEHAEHAFSRLDKFKGLMAVMLQIEGRSKPAFCPQLKNKLSYELADEEYFRRTQIIEANLYAVLAEQSKRARLLEPGNWLESSASLGELSDLKRREDFRSAV